MAGTSGRVAVAFTDGSGNDALVTAANPLPVTGGTGGSGGAGGTLTDRSGTITTGNAAQQLAAVNAARRYLLIINPLTAGEQGIATAETLWINFTTTAVASRPSIPLEPGQALTFEGGFVSTELVSVIAATTSHGWIAKEG